MMYGVWCGLYVGHYARVRRAKRYGGGPPWGPAWPQRGHTKAGPIGFSRREERSPWERAKKHGRSRDGGGLHPHPGVEDFKAK